MKRIHTYLLRSAIVMLTMTSLVACKASNGSAKDLVSKVLGGRATVVKQFTATSNLQGFVVESTTMHGQKGLVYAADDGSYLVSGNIISADGKNITQENYQTYIANVSAPGAFKDAAKTNWFLMGKKNAPHKTYMIVEPNCSACHVAYEKLKPAIASGQLAVRFIVVSFLKADSEAKAAAILSAKDPSSAFATDEKGFVMKTESGGIKPLKEVSNALKAKIKANIDFMQKHRFPATPVFIYQTKNGKAKAEVGFPGGKIGQTMIDSMGNKF